MVTDFRDGARFVKAALQVNPYQYLVKNGKPLNGLTEDTYNQAIVAACIENEIAVIAITDHYSVADSVSLVALAEEHDIKAFPGFEAAASDGVHFLCIFDRETPTVEIERCVGQCGVKTTKDERGIGTLDSRALLRAADEWGAVAIAAHSTDSKGLLGHLSGAARESVWKDERLIAVALSSPLDNLDAAHKSILDGKAPEYQRPHSPAVAYAGDVVSGADLSKDTSWTWLKMSEPSLDGLRHAFLDPGSRLRLPDVAAHDVYPIITEISWEGGFLDKERILLNPALNVIVGPRGAGKSTVLESIRFVLGLEPLGDDARVAHDGFVNHVLGQGTKVTLRVTTPSNAEGWIVERAVHGSTRVLTPNGDTCDLEIVDILGRVEFFGQHEVAELARMPEARTRLLDRFRIAAPPPKRTRPDLAGLLADSRSAIQKETRAIAGFETRLEKLPGITLQLEANEKAGLAGRLDLEARYEKEAPLFDEVEELLTLCREHIDDSPELDLAFLTTEETAELPSALRFENLRIKLEALASARNKANVDLTNEVDALTEELKRARADRADEQQAQQDEFLERLRELKAEKIDGERHLELERTRAKLEADAKKLAGEIVKSCGSGWRIQPVSALVL